ncbi:MAG: hypothetical protein O7H41_11285 [Planctomycetota bacterium]|nr:hypothetical protein [Planctomycetota bacterium]
MSRAPLKLAVVVAVMLLSGCVIQSLHPFFTKEAVIPLPEKLKGKWDVFDPDDKSIAKKPWEFQEDGDVITYDDKGRRGKLEATFFKVGDQLYVDATVGGAVEKNQSMWRAITILPIHVVCKVEISKEKVLLRPLDFKWMKKALKKEKAKLSKEDVKVEGDDHFVLTASSEEWMKFLEETGDEAFHKEFTIVLKRPAKDR